MTQDPEMNLNEAFGLIVRFTIRSDCEQEFDQLVRTTVAAIRQREPGTLLYGVHTIESEPRCRIFYELYKNKSAFQTHEDQPHVRRFLSERGRLVERVDVDQLSPTVYAGLVQTAT